MTTDLSEHVPPHDAEAEEAVVASCFLDGSAAWAALEIVTPAHFYVHGPRVIFTAIESAMRSGGKADAVTIAGALRDAGTLDGVGGVERLRRAADEVPTSANVRLYAERVRATARLRQLARSGVDLARTCYGLGGAAPEDREPEAARHAANILRVLNDRTRSTCRTMAVLALGEGERMRNPTTTAGVASGFESIDRVVGGLRPAELIILAGRPSMGKTALGSAIARRVAMSIPPRPVLIFSAEMSAEQLTQNMIAQLAHVNSRFVASGRMSRADYDRAMKAAQDLYERAPIHIDDRSAPSVVAIRAQAESVRPALIVIDYLQLMSEPSQGRSDNRTAQVGRIASGLKALAKDMGIPVIALAQLNRAVESRAGNKPQMSDLRESGDIENHADVIMLVHRPEYYERDKIDLRGKASVIVAKNRNGAVGEAALTFDATTVRFEDAPNEGATHGDT